MVLIKVNWYKPSGKWYASEEMNLPDCLEADKVKEYIEAKQTQLLPSWTQSDWLVSVTVLYQSSVDQRFFERLFKYGECK